VVGQLLKLKGKGKGKHGDLTCYNCNVSHISKKPRKSKLRDKSGKNKKGDGLDTTKPSKDTEESGAWAAVEELDWIDDVVEEMENKGLANIVENFNDTSGEAFVTETARTEGLPNCTTLAARTILPLTAQSH